MLSASGVARRDWGRCPKPDAQWTAFPKGRPIPDIRLQLPPSNEMSTEDTNCWLSHNLSLKFYLWRSLLTLGRAPVISVFGPEQLPCLQPPTCDQRIPRGRERGAPSFQWRKWWCGAENGWSSGEPGEPWHPFLPSSWACLLGGSFSSQSHLKMQSVPSGRLEQVQEGEEHSLWSQPALGGTLSSCYFYLPWSRRFASQDLQVLIFRVVLKIQNNAGKDTSPVPGCTVSIDKCRVPHYQPLCKAGSRDHMGWKLESTLVKSCPA